MNDLLGKNTSSSSSIVVSEKRPQRPGGCVGIFFQLFDWNRRLAKKKLFSKKLLPPARAKRASKKFGGDDKLPTAKLLLIADENRGGFPNGRKSGLDNVDNKCNAESNHEMRSPSLVARLMGLESMPNVRREKPKSKKVLFPEFDVGNGRNMGDNIRRDDNVRCLERFDCDQGEFHLGKGNGKVDSRPQKLQKTGLFERRSVTRFGAEALQFRSVLSRSRKHQPKLVSPVKSPRAGRNAARLMGAATKILEPGLHASNRAKCTLTYSPSIHISSREEVTPHEQTYLTMEDAKQASYYPNASKHLKGQSSCKSCGNWLDFVDSRSNGDEQGIPNTSFALGLGGAPPLGPGRSKVKLTESSLLQERDEGSCKYQANKHSRSNMSTETKHIFQEYHDQYHSSSHRIRYQTDAAPAMSRNPRTKRQNHMLSKDRGSMRPKLNHRRDPFPDSSVDGTKNFVAVNRHSASRTKASAPSKVLNNLKNNTDINAADKKDDSSSAMRSSGSRMRPISGTSRIDNASFNQSAIRKQRDVKNDLISGRAVGSNGCSKSQNRVKSEHPTGAKSDITNSGKDAGSISFTFTSPMRHNVESLYPTTMEKTRGHSEFVSSNSSPVKKLTLDANIGKPSSRLATHLKGDALGALLEEKLKELTCRDRDGVGSGDDTPGRSTAAILEELIVALTAENPISLKDEDSCSIVLSQDDSSSSASQDPYNDTTSSSPKVIANHDVQQIELKPHAVSTGFPLCRNGEHQSPGSVLDVSFSNDGCFSESLDSTIGNKLHTESRTTSYNQVQLSEYDVELSDCASSTCTSQIRVDRVADSLDNVHSELYNNDEDNIEFVRNKLNYALEVIVNADLLLGSICNTSSIGGFPIFPLLDKLEAISDAPWTNPSSRMGIMLSKSGYLLRRFLLDCLLEFLDLKHDYYCKSRFKTWPALPLQINGDSLTREVHKEIQWFADLAGMSSVEILERECDHSLETWIEFEADAFDIGELIESDILQILVDELVVDLEQCRLNQGNQVMLLHG